jgi:hypothetical protein
MLSRKCWNNKWVLAARPTTAALASAAPRTTASPAAFARNHGTGFIDYQCAAHQIATIAGFDGTISRGVIVNLNEPESPSLAGETITHHVHAIDGDTLLREEIR